MDPIVRDFLERAARRAEAYGYDKDALRFEYERRLGGSFSRTLSGCRAERDLFREAWRVAMAWHRRAGNLACLEGL